MRTPLLLQSMVSTVARLQHVAVKKALGFFAFLAPVRFLKPQTLWPAETACAVVCPGVVAIDLAPTAVDAAKEFLKASSSPAAARVEAGKSLAKNVAGRGIYVGFEVISAITCQPWGGGGVCRLLQVRAGAQSGCDLGLPAAPV